MKKQNLQIGFDARMLAYRQAGIGQYSLALLQELAILQQELGQFDLTVWQSRKEKRKPAAWLGADLAKRTLWTPPHHRLERVALPVELLNNGPSVWHTPDFIPPFWRWRWDGHSFRPIASVITIHDLAFLRFPHLLTDESRAYYGQVGRAAHSAERIIAVSQSTARDIIEQLGVSPSKVRVIYEAANSRYRPIPTSDLKSGLLDRLQTAGIGPNDSFLLFVGTLEPRKNLPVLLKAFRELCNAVDAPPKLVIAGREGWLYADIYRLAKTLGLDEQVVWLGGVSEDDLPYLYNRAALLALPSLYEGFGLPPLEALACGCPVIVAQTSSLPEVVGTLGESLPPEDVGAWLRALQNGWQNRASQRAKTLVEGPAWAATFSWQRAAAQTLNVYREAILETVG